MLDAGDRATGPAARARSERILLEFVSANPTGPLVAANGQPRRLRRRAGRGSWPTTATRCADEYYFNDAGGQIHRLGESVLARANGAPVPEGGYQGEYVHELAAQIPDVQTLSADEAAAAAVEMLLDPDQGHA